MQISISSLVRKSPLTFYIHDVKKQLSNRKEFMFMDEMTSFEILVVPQFIYSLFNDDNQIS